MSVREDRVVDEPDRSEGRVLQYPMPAVTSSGVVGAPSGATAQRGAELFAMHVDAFAALLVRALLIAALPTRLEAALALGVFAPMSLVSMAACTAAFAWVLTRPIIEPVYRGVLIPGLGLFGVVFGLWYTGIG
ncbi:MAG TPA: hypothetical protein VER75_09400 [Thermoleophilaceae bacterium]|nr:hypothetical protein [Thermoleophilaceae bacterium]